jgi:MacB-like periplasmic core domain
VEGWDIGQGFHVIGQPKVDQSQELAAHSQMVSSGYFGTLGIPLLRGRAFTSDDTTANQPVCIVNQEFVRQYLKGRDPIGALVSVRAMAPEGPKPVVRQVVGVSHQVMHGIACKAFRRHSPSKHSLLCNSRSHAAQRHECSMALVSPATGHNLPQLPISTGKIFPARQTAPPNRLILSALACGS